MDATDIHSQEEQVPQKTPTQKRQIDSSDDDHEPQPKRARLTRKNLAQFDKMARKKKSSDDSEAKTISTTTSGFAIQAYKNGIRGPTDSKPPTSLRDTQQRLAAPRETASPPESEYNRYVKKVGRVPNEATMVVETSKLLKDYEDDDDYGRSFNQSFSAFPEDTGFNQGLSAPQPDFVEGPQMQTYRPFPVDEHVSGAVLYKDDPYSLTLPHLAGEWKGRGKNMEEGRMQAAYDGAALVYARNQALTYTGNPDPPGHSEIMTFTTDGSQLNFFAHHATPTEDSTLEYHQYPIKSTSLVGSYEGYKEGRRHLRNAQDHAREESYKLRDDLQSHWKTTRDQPVPLPTITDDEAAYEIVEQPPSTYEYGADHQATEYPPAPPKKSKPPKEDRRSSSHSHYTRSTTNNPRPSHDHASGSSHKRTSSSHTSSHQSSRHSSKHKSYWKKGPSDWELLSQALRWNGLLA